MHIGLDVELGGQLFTFFIWSVCSICQIFSSVILQIHLFVTSEIHFLIQVSKVTKFYQNVVDL